MELVQECVDTSSHGIVISTAIGPARVSSFSAFTPNTFDSTSNPHSGLRSAHAVGRLDFDIYEVSFKKSGLISQMDGTCGSPCVGSVRSNISLIMSARFVYPDRLIGF